MAKRRTNPDFLNGVPELLILRLLDVEPLHGYALVKRIRVLSGEVLAFGEGCIYPVLHRLEAGGLVRSRRGIVEGRSRVIYRLTGKGRRRLAESAADWRRAVRAVDRVMGEAGHGRPIELA